MRRAALIALLAFAGSACTIDVDIKISLDQNGSGSVSVDITTDEEFQDLHQLTGRDFEDLVAARGSEIGLPFTVTAGAVTRYSAETSVVPAQTLEAILEGLAPGIGDITISRETASLELDGSLNPLTSIDDVAPYFVDSDPGQFADAATVTVTMTMPGEIENSTATSRQNGRLTWVLPFSDSGTRLFARSILVQESNGFPWTLTILVGTGVLAFGFLIAIRSGLARADVPAPQPLRVAPSPEAQAVAPRSTPPEDHPVAPESTPPGDQPVAPPEDPTED